MVLFDQMYVVFALYERKKQHTKYQYRSAKAQHANCESSKQMTGYKHIWCLHSPNANTKYEKYQSCSAG
jgi:hypothetical protein